VNYLDIILLVPLVWAAWRGFKKGLILEVFSLLALFAGLYGGIHFSDQVALWLQNDLKLASDYLPIISFAVTFIAVVVAVHFVGKALQKVIKMAALGLVNKLLGLAFSVAKIGLALSVALVFLSSINKSFKLIPEEHQQQSLMYAPVYNFSLIVIPAVKSSEFYKRLQNEGLIPNFDKSELVEATSCSFPQRQLKEAKHREH